MPVYSFCETTAAYFWHIRPLSLAGPRYGGGADTKTLCGLKAVWDLKVDITDRMLAVNNICRLCCEAYKAATAAGDEEESDD